MRKSASIFFAAMLLAACQAMPDRASAQGMILPDPSTLGGHVTASGPIPTLVGCTIVAGSTDTAGSCTTTATSGSITFGRTFTLAPACLVVDASATSTVSMPVYTVSATAITLSTIISGHILFWFCPGKIGST